MNMNINKDIYDTSVLPDDIFALKGNEFFYVVRSLVGEVITNILRVQMIDSANNLLNTSDVFEIFKYDSEDLDEVRTTACFKMRNGQYIIRAGVINNMEYLKSILKKKLSESHSNSISSEKEEYYRLISQNSMLKSLIEWYLQHAELNDATSTINRDDKTKSSFFTLSLINTITKNIVQSKKHYRYDDRIKEFALVLYILGAKQCYEFVRLNIIGALPNLTTINNLITSADPLLTEGQFRFDVLNQYLNTLNIKFGFCAEDCTGILQKVQYDATTNSFVGFVTRLSNGIPVLNSYRTDSYEQLKYWFEHTEKSSLLNIHMFQPIPQADHPHTPTPFLLSAYGVDNTSTAVDIMQRWLYTYDSCIQNQTRIIGFSTDGDPKYMRAMRLACGFFAHSINFEAHQRSDAFDIHPAGQWPWFFLRSRQLFLFFQDATHLVTKWRNRLLSQVADMRIGNQTISTKFLYDIINDTQYSKLDHGLILSDLNPKDRQNYRSCVKLTVDDLLSILNKNRNAHATLVYLQSLKMLITAYIEKSTTPSKRLELAWCVVFFCRLWWGWLQNVRLSNGPKTVTTTKKTKYTFFITKTAYLSVEINAHMLLYLILLVKKGQLPKEALHIYLFSSQSCESMFRNTRSLTGMYSTKVNFTVADFLHRSQKLTILNTIKAKQEGNPNNEHLCFPLHHKHKNDEDLIFYQNLDDVYSLDIEKIIDNSYKMALDLIASLGVIPVLKQHHIIELDSLSLYIFSQFNEKSRTNDYRMISITPGKSRQGPESDTDDEEYDQDDYLRIKEDVLKDMAKDDDSSTESFDDEEESIQSTKSDFDGLKIHNNIKSEHKDHYFRMKINDTFRYVHKQTACWILTNGGGRLSTDRLRRVMQAGAK